MLALAKGRSSSFVLLSVIRKVYAAAFRSGHVLHFRWVPSEVNFADEGSSFYDPCYQPQKCILYRLRAQSQPDSDVRQLPIANSNSVASSVQDTPPVAERSGRIHEPLTASRRILCLLPFVSALSGVQLPKKRVQPLDCPEGKRVG